MPRESESDGEGCVGGDRLCEIEDGEVVYAGVVSGLPAGLDISIVCEFDGGFYFFSVGLSLR